MFFWTFNGAWIFTIDQLLGAKGANIGISYYGIFDKIFPVYLDNYYFLSIIYYGIFIIGIQLFIWIFGAKRDKGKIITFESINISIQTLSLITIVLIFLNLFIIYPDLKEAVKQGKSFYFQLNNSTNRFLTIYQLICKIVAFISFFNLIIYFLEKTDNFFAFKRNYFTSISVILCLIFVVCFFVLTGNKHDLLFTGVFGLLYMLRKITWKKIINFIVFSFILLILFISTDFTRGIQFFSSNNLKQINLPQTNNSQTNNSQTNEQTEIFNNQRQDINNSFKNFLFHNEMFYAHFSMYGVLSKNIPLTYGKSFNYLIHSLIPRSIINERPEDIYQYYARSVKVKKGQGYTIHHATAWYLNFGFLGIILSVFVVGGIWCLLNNLYFKNTFKNRFFKLFGIVSPFLFVAFLPNLIRSGPEAYKGVVFESLLIPVLIIYFASRTNIKIFKNNNTN